MYRIVYEKRGDVTTGVRVQKRVFSRSGCGCKGYQSHERWANRGRRMFTVEQAKEYAAWLMKQDRQSWPELEYVEAGTILEPQSEATMRECVAEPAYFGQYGRK